MMDERQVPNRHSQNIMQMIQEIRMINMQKRHMHYSTPEPTTYAQRDRLMINRKAILQPKLPVRKKSKPNPIEIDQQQVDVAESKPPTPKMAMIRDKNTKSHNDMSKLRVPSAIPKPSAISESLPQIDKIIEKKKHRRNISEPRISLPSLHTYERSLKRLRKLEQNLIEPKSTAKRDSFISKKLNTSKISIDEAKEHVKLPKKDYETISGWETGNLDAQGFY